MACSIVQGTCQGVRQMACSIVQGTCQGVRRIACSMLVRGVRGRCLGVRLIACSMLKVVAERVMAKGRAGVLIRHRMLISYPRCAIWKQWVWETQKSERKRKRRRLNTKRRVGDPICTALLRGHLVAKTIKRQRKTIQSRVAQSDTRSLVDQCGTRSLVDQCDTRSLVDQSDTRHRVVSFDMLTRTLMYCEPDPRPWLATEPEPPALGRGCLRQLLVSEFSCTPLVRAMDDRDLLHLQARVFSSSLLAANAW